VEKRVEELSWEDPLGFWKSEGWRDPKGRSSTQTLFVDARMSCSLRSGHREKD
jgi:hypothetical protein